MKFLNLLEGSQPILADGAMGTMLHANNISFSESFDALNISNPAAIAQIHTAYIEAGAEIIFTNTFSANRYRLAKHGIEDQVVAINQAGVELAKRVVLASFKDILIAGDVGPLGVRLVPFGRVQLEQAHDAFKEQLEALINTGVDLIVFETFSDLHEIKEGILAARELSELPIIASMTFTRDDLTLLGNTPEKVAKTLYDTGATLIGVNCSGGPAQILRILNRMRSAVPAARFTVKPNAGLPEQIEGRIMYPAGPKYFGDYALAFRQAGVSMMGGCCGTTPAHITEMRKALDTISGQPPLTITNQTPRLEQGVAEIFEPTQLAQRLDAGKFVFAVEMSPPRGISTQKTIAAASMLREAGADVIDLADSPMARMRMSPWAICNVLQQRLGIDTTLHFPTRGRNLLRVQGDLLAAHALNVRNIFVVMGDPTSIGDFPDAMDDYDVVPSGLIELIKNGFNKGVDYAGSDIGQPTSFFAGCALNLTPNNPEREVTVLHRKIKAGADFALTQPIFNPAAAKAFIDEYNKKTGGVNFYILAGILPLYSLRHALFLQNELPGVTIPESILYRIEENPDDTWKEGIKIALEIIEQIRNWVHGIYLMPPFGRYNLAAEIIEAAING